MGLTVSQQSVAWKQLKEQVSKVPDPTLRNAMMAEFRKRALRDWGYNPDDRNGVAKKETVELDDWEKEFLQDIQKAQMFELDTRKSKREHEIREARARMRDFIESGGNLDDIPGDIRIDFIRSLYYDTLHKTCEQLVNQLMELDDDATNR